MSISNTVKKWAKDIGKKDPSPSERWAGRKNTPERKESEKKRKFAAKMKKGGYPGRFINEREQETHD